MTAFAGFEMPLYYKDIGPEHLAVRNSVGIFDISHMGRLIITGADVEQFLNYVLTNDVSTLQPDSAQYSVMCNESGGILDDFVLYRIEKEKFLLIPNASNREKDYAWLIKHSENYKVEIEDVSDDVAMFAVQGPNAAKTLQQISTEDLSLVGRFKCRKARLANVKVFLARTGYTGEDGFEVFIWNTPLTRPDNAVKLWSTILEKGKNWGIEPCGLGARDTLRLEAGLCLYGNDIAESTSPIEAGLGFVVKLQKERFIGREVLVKQKDEGAKRRRVGLKMLSSGIPRADYEIHGETGGKIGLLTSGTFSPLLKCGIGMGYVGAAQAQEGKRVGVKIRDKTAVGQITAFPLYDADKYGFKRKTS
jgi:aminomethyltransferase